MKQATKSTFKTDLVAQGFVYFPMIVCYVLGFLMGGFFILGMLLQFFVGLIQLFSGAYHSIQYKDNVHQQYFIGAIAYLLALFLGAWVGGLNGGGGDLLIIFFLFIIPVGIATWYYHMTWKLYQKAPGIETGERPPSSFTYDDVLDDAIL